MGYSTYSFEDLSLVIEHPRKGQLTLQGSGVGSVTFAMSTDVSAHDLSADGSVMTTKVKASNGTIAISLQQTSESHRWLTELYNDLVAAPASEWAIISCSGTSRAMQVTHEGNYISIQKRADKPYQQQGGQVTWTLMAAELIERVEKI